MFDFLIFENTLVYIEAYLIALFIIDKNFILKRIIIFCNILKKNFLKKITKVNTIFFNNKLANLRQQKNKTLVL